MPEGNRNASSRTRRNRARHRAGPDGNVHHRRFSRRGCEPGPHAGDVPTHLVRSEQRQLRYAAPQGAHGAHLPSIHLGLAKQPDWPTAGPPLRELYAGDAGALAEHGRLLDEAAAARPDDPALEFLRAYVRWFDGRRDEARALFRKVRASVTKPEAVDRFLQAPGA